MKGDFRKYYQYLLIAFLLLQSCATKGMFATTNYKGDSPREPYDISLSGSWMALLPEPDPGEQDSGKISKFGWRKVYVPANWYPQGVDHAGVLWYRKTFTMDPDMLKRSFTLVFRGVDFTASVWLNGTYLGSHEGYFAPFSFPVSGVVRSKNVLMVRVESPMEKPGPECGLHKRLIKGVFGHHDTRSGGAWSADGQDKNSGGIWDDVFLHASREVYVENVRITPKVIVQESQGISSVELSVVRHGKKVDKLPVDVNIKVVSHNFESETGRVFTFSKRLMLKNGKNTAIIELSKMPVKFWWPWEMGYPHLYRFEITLRRGKKILETSNKVVGFRSVKCDPDTMIWSVNGKRIFLRGTNYIGSHWLSEMGRDQYYRDLVLMKAANINAVRVHAHVTGEEFYRLCDEMGYLCGRIFPYNGGVRTMGIG